MIFQFNSSTYHSSLTESDLILIILLPTLNHRNTSSWTDYSVTAFQGHNGKLILTAVLLSLIMFCFFHTVGQDSHMDKTWIPHSSQDLKWALPQICIQFVSGVRQNSKHEYLAFNFHSIITSHLISWCFPSNIPSKC